MIGLALPKKFGSVFLLPNLHKNMFQNLFSGVERIFSFESESKI